MGGGWAAETAAAESRPDWVRGHGSMRWVGCPVFGFAAPAEHFSHVVIDCSRQKMGAVMTKGKCVDFLKDNEKAN